MRRSGGLHGDPSLQHGLEEAPPTPDALPTGGVSEVQVKDRNGPIYYLEMKMGRQFHTIEPPSPVLAGYFDHEMAASTARAWSQYIVSCAHLVRKQLGDQEFDRQFQRRRNWCRDNCLDDFTIDILLSSVEFSFVDEQDARQFRLTFC
jgi:hypothetical protein